MEERIKQEIKRLNVIAEKYEDLNNKTKGRYRWRSNAIGESIEVLLSILEGDSISDEWNVCYEEDLRESQK